MRVLSLLLALPACYLSHETPAEREPPLRVCADGTPAAAEVCGDGADQDCDGWDAPCPADVCATAARRTRTVTLSFDDPAGCPWGDDDNETRADGLFRARTEQVEEVALPARAVLCGLDVVAAQDDVVFDDELIVTFADAVLVQSFTPDAPREGSGELVRYRWHDLLDRPLPTRPTTPYCLGAAGECALPNSEMRGRFALALHGTTGTALGELAIREGRAAVRVVTTGDNNVDSDCHHSPLDLEVTAAFVEP